MSTGVNAADGSVPGAQIFEQVYAAAADATAVITSVVRSMPLPDDVEEREDIAEEVDTPVRLPHIGGR
jgi:hypothetical protein